jgi:uncharacterized protein
MNILTFDGGGIRGAFTASVISEIEKTIPNFSEKFDVIAGTSTGAIIASMVALNKSSEDILQLYTLYSKDIFKQDPWRLQGALTSKYDQTILRSIVDKHLGNTKLGDIKQRLCITAANINTGEIELFDSKLSSHKDLLLSDVVLASSAAPSYFDPVKINGFLYADGGIWAKDPSMPVVLKLHSEGVNLNHIRIFSIGTGVRKFLYTDSQTRSLGWGLLSGWEGTKLFGLIDKLQGNYSQFALSSLLKPDNYHKIELELDTQVDLDDTSQVEQFIELGIKKVHAEIDQVSLFISQTKKLTWWQKLIKK